MQDKSLLGSRYVCYECGCKFYDLNRPEALCPDCNVNQEAAPSHDISSILGNSKGRARAAAKAPAESQPEVDSDDELDFDEDQEEEDDLPSEIEA